MGLPAKYNSPEEMQIAIDAYFDTCDRDKKPYTISGLCNSLGIVRQTLLNYKEKKEYEHTVIMAKARCEQYAEEMLFTGKNVAGAIFVLKNHYGWRDEFYNKNQHKISKFENVSDEKLIDIMVSDESDKG